MKKDSLKIVALLLILVVTNLIITSKYSEGTKDPNWEYIKNRVFDGETSVYRKSEGPILFDLYQGTKSDSLLVKAVILELKILLPNKKIDFFNNFMGMSFSQMIEYGINKPSYKKNGFTIEQIDDSRILLNFEPSYLYKNRGNQFINLGAGYSIQISPFERVGDKIKRAIPLTLVAIGDDYTFEQKKEYLMVGVLRNLVYLQNEPPIINQHSVFASEEIQGLDRRILDSDVFLLQKLYSDDFFVQFKTYLDNNYSWWYVTTFLNKKLATLYAVLIVGSIGLLVFILLYGLFQNKTFKYSFLNYFLPLYCIWIYYANLHFIYRYLTDFNSPVSWKDTIIFGLLIVFIIALISSFLLWCLEKFLVKGNIVFSLNLILKTIFTFLAFSIPIIAIFFLDGHTNEGIDFFFPSFLIFVALALGRGLLIYLNHISDSLVKEKDVELSKLKEINAQAETRLLQSQINPHFLYNSLNSIASLAPIDAQKTQEMAHSLSDLFKYSINRKGKKMSTILEEVEMVKTYLDIEKIRFGDRLQFNVLIDKELENNEIPLFLIQPLVENAVKYGISQNEGEGIIILKISKEQNEIRISVRDNGPNFPEGLVSGHGLQTVFDLLRLTYGDKATLNWNNTPEKMIIITIPETL